MEENNNQFGEPQNNSWGTNGGTTPNDQTWGQADQNSTAANSWGNVDPNASQANNWGGNDQNTAWNQDQQMNQWDQTQVQWNAQPGYGVPGGDYTDQSQNGYGQDYAQQNQYGYDMNQNGYGQDYAQQNQFGYDQSQNGYGQDAYGMNGYAQNGFNNNNTEKPKKKGLLIGIIAGVVAVAAIVVCIVLFGNGSKLPKKIEDFKYSTSVTFDDFLDAYFDGDKKAFEKSASAPNYEKLVSKPDTYKNDTFEITGYVTSVDGDSLYYVSSKVSSKEKYYCYNAAGKKGAVAVGDYVTVYATFTQLSDDGTYPCMVVWECEKKDAPAASLSSAEPESTDAKESKETETSTTTTTESKSEDEITMPEVEYTAEEQAVIDNLEVSQLYGREDNILYYLIENNNNNKYVFAMDMYIYFYDKDENCIGYDYTYVSFKSNQPYEFGAMYCKDEDYNYLPYDHAYYYFDDISLYSFEEACMFDALSAEFTGQEDYSVKGTISNTSGQKLDVSGYAVFYDEEGYIVGYDSFYVDDVEESAEFDAYFWNYDEYEISTYDIYWDSIYVN